MERGKTVQGKRPTKGKGSILPPGDLFALGSKPVASGGSSGDRKRESTSLLTPTPALKKPKILAQGQTFTPLGRPSDRDADRRSSPIPAVSHQFEEFAIDVDSSHLLDEVLSAEQSGDDDRLEGLLCGVVKHLHNNRSKPDQIVYLSLMYLAKSKSSLFSSEVVIEAFCSLLKRDMSLNFKSKGNSIVSVLACNVLMKAYNEEDNWPDDFVKVYIDDALGERVWVDRADTKGFVDNILTAFKTNLPKGDMGSLDSKTEQSGASAPGSPAVTLSIDEEDNKMEIDLERSNMSTGEVQNIQVTQRFPYQIDNIESFVMDIIREQLTKRPLMDASAKSLIKLLVVTAGYGEVRQLAAQKLEPWLQNPKLARAAQELLLSICMNCSQHDASDMEVIALLIKMRMKTKPLINHYLHCIRELLGQHSDNLQMVLTHTIYNELSPARNPNNMALIGVVFQAKPDLAATILAEIFQDLLSNKDDYLRALRALFREIVRSLRHDFDFSVFALALLQERTEAKFADMEQAYKERFLHSTADLISLCALQAITPSVRETVSAIQKGEKKDLDVLYKFQNQIASIQRDAIWWLHTIVPRFIDPKPQEFMHCIRKVLFMESIDQYCKDNWPAEADRGPMFKLDTECPVLEDTLMRLLVIGLSRELPLNPADAVEFVDLLVRRAANQYSEGRKVLQVQRLELFDALLNLCAYRHPENIALPQGYNPPSLAISNLYWKSWIILLIISAFNPSTFGLAAWDNYPILKCLIEMVMTNNYKFPPPTTAVDDSVIEEIRNKEIQVAQKEKEEILEFEGYLAASTTKVTITESNSLLIAQLTSMEPNGMARKPPQAMIDQLRTLNDTLKIGQMLCRSRNPDFLLDIIQRQGTTQSMPWLAELVESSEGSLDVLPVQCLCEFLLHETQDTGKDAGDEDSVKFERHKRKQKMKKQQQLLSRLQTLVHDPNSDSTTTQEVMDYFLKRLSSTQASNRMLATKGLSMIISRSQLSPMEEESQSKFDESQHNWLLNHLPTLPMFPQVKEKTCKALRQAIQIEGDPSLVSAYIMFLSQHVADQPLQSLDEVALDIAQLIVERTTVMNYILPSMSEEMDKQSLDSLEALIFFFVNYLRKAKEQNTAGYSWSNTQDQVILQWEGGESATMHIVVVHSMIILLSYGPARDQDQYSELLETWFPSNTKPPSAFLLDTSEEALLLPDWLKLRMIRTNVDRLITAALQDLDPCQLLLFVQSFGIPVHSMSRLLQCLDKAVSVDRSTVDQSVVDKSYMAQLIEVQHKRGAKGGDQFYSMLTGGAKLELPKDDIEMDESSLDSAVWRCQGQSEGVVETVPSSHIVNTLLQAFDPSGRKSPDSEAHFRSLIMTISKNGSGVLDVTRGFLEVLSGNSGADFVKSIMQSNRACSLLKMLICKKNNAGMKQCLKQVIDRLGRFCGDQKSPLSSIVQQYLSAQNSAPSRKPHLKVNNETQFLSELSKSSSDTRKLQSMISESMRVAIATNEVSSGTKVACTALNRHQLGDKGDPMLVSTACLFVDWLELLDPEVIRQVPELEEKLLFARQTVSKLQDQDKRSGSSQPYLLAVLTHQTSWATLHRCINSLLSDSNRGYDPVSVLDFLWACVHIPKIWQGRERKISKNQQPDDILGLDEHKLETVTSYIIQEAQSDRSNSPKSAQQTSVSIVKRMELLKACLCNNKNKVKYLVSKIEEKLSSSSADSQLYENLLLELYLQYPYILTWIHNHESVTAEAKSSKHSQTQMDLISHRLISGLYQGGKGKKHDSRMADVNIACRKLAAEHPVLLLRQLPAIVALLKGKTQFTFPEFRQRNFLVLYTYVLGILELLQPSIFNKEHQVLHDILEEYFNMLKAYSLQYKQVAPVIVKLVAFLNQYVDHDTATATSLLQKHVVLLGNVSNLYPDMYILKSLLAGLTLPRHNQEIIPSQEGSSGVKYPGRPASPWAMSHLAPFLQKIKKDNQDARHNQEIIPSQEGSSGVKYPGRSASPWAMSHLAPFLQKIKKDNQDARHNQEEIIPSQEGSSGVKYPGRPASPWAMSHLAPFLQKIKKDNQDARHNQAEIIPSQEGSSGVKYPGRPTSPWAMSHLAPFLQKIKKDNQDARHNQEIIPSQEGSSGVKYPGRPASPWAMSHLAPFLQKIKKDNQDEVLMVLQELDETSKRKPEILTHFSEDLKRLMLTFNDQCRNHAFELVKRHIKQSPKLACEFVPTYLHCLEHQNPDVVTSALTNLAEFTLMCQEFADTILQSAFSVGINTSIETSSYISESLQLLNLDLMST